MTKCLFCPNAADSKEHVFPRWITSALPGAGDLIHELERGAEKSTWSAGYLGVQHRIVCKQCNHGWMHDLEEAARPMLSPMISDPDCPQRLMRSDQRILAKWAIKTAVVLHSIANEPPHAPIGWCEQLKADSIPTEASAWIVQRLAPAVSRAAAVLLPQPDHEFWACSFAFGHCAFQAWLWNAPAPDDLYIDQRLWPPQAVLAWPPLLALGGADFSQFAERKAKLKVIEPT